MTLRPDVAELVRTALLDAAATGDAGAPYAVPASALERLVDLARGAQDVPHRPGKFPARRDLTKGERLKLAREAMFPSAQALADRLSMKGVTVRSHENNQNGYPAWTARRYAEALGVSVSWLLYGDER